MWTDHFVARGLFDYRVAGQGAGTIAAVPLPIAPAFRDGVVSKTSPRLEEKPDTA